MRLRRLDGTPEQIREALDRLEAAGVLSDAAVAEAEVAARLRKGEPPARVRQQLQRKGVASAVASAALQEVLQQEGFDEADACLQAAEKRARALRGLAPEVAHRRLSAFLLRRGFGGGIVRSVTRRVLGAD